MRRRGLRSRKHQHGLFPHVIRRIVSAAYQNERLHVVHEGIDTQLACPNPQVSYEVRGIRVDRSVPTITFVNVILNVYGASTPSCGPCLSFSANIRLCVVIVGDNEGGYGGASFRLASARGDVAGIEVSLILNGSIF